MKEICSPRTRIASRNWAQFVDECYSQRKKYSRNSFSLSFIELCIDLIHLRSILKGSCTCTNMYSFDFFRYVQNTFCHTIFDQTSFFSGLLFIRIVRCSLNFSEKNIFWDLPMSSTHLKRVTFWPSLNAQLWIRLQRLAKVIEALSNRYLNLFVVSLVLFLLSCKYYPFDDYEFRKKVHKECNSNINYKIFNIFSDNNLKGLNFWKIGMTPISFEFWIFILLCIVLLLKMIYWCNKRIFKRVTIQTYSVLLRCNL